VSDKNFKYQASNVYTQPIWKSASRSSACHQQVGKPAVRRFGHQPVPQTAKSLLYRSYGALILSHPILQIFRDYGAGGSPPRVLKGQSYLPQQSAIPPWGSIADAGHGGARGWKVPLERRAPTRRDGLATINWPGRCPALQRVCKLADNLTPRRAAFFTLHESRITFGGNKFFEHFVLDVSKKQKSVIDVWPGIPFSIVLHT
jgi:hypothetical protein